MDTTDQLTKLANRIGEPADVTQQRWTQAQLLDFLNEARHSVAEETRCFPVSDSQLTTAGTRAYSVTNDFIALNHVEYDGRPLRIVRHDHWRDVVGSDDTITGDPAVVKYFARQLVLYPTPTSGNKTLLYNGWAYPVDLVLLGVDASLTDFAAESCIWESAATIKGSDERNNSFELMKAEMKMKKLKEQYSPKGPRYVKTGDLYLPWRPLV